MAAAQSSPAPASAEPRHGMRIFLIWLVLSLVVDLLIWFLLYPHLPPGDMTSSAKHQQFDIAVMMVMGAPVLIFVWVYVGYALVVWRHRPGDDEDGPYITGSTRAGIRIQAIWIIATSVIVLGLFVFGTVELIAPAGAGAGEGPSPVWQISGVHTTAWTPGSNNILQVQVIGQEWSFTYRFPQFGGMQTTRLVLPDNTPVEFHVTSLDVIHSFWAYKLGVKADANPGVDNVAYTKTRQLGGFTVRCNELCGLWHGAMFNSGYVVTPSAFQAWASGVQAKEQSNGLLAALPRYALTYDPTVIPQLGRAVVKITGITGANGYYYPGPQAGTPGDPVSP
jgi:cytochrome c oxidase subunit II